MPTDSGRPHDIYRCPACRVAVWSDYGRRGVLRFVRVGTLDEPSALSPDVHIYTRSKLPWVKLPDGVPSFEAYYDAKKLWPAGGHPPGEAGERAATPPRRGKAQAPRAKIRRSRLTRAEIETLFSRLQAKNPHPKGELDYVNPFTLLVAVVLSAQTTDVGV